MNKGEGSKRHGDNKNLPHEAMTLEYESEISPKAFHESTRFKRADSLWFSA